RNTRNLIAFLQLVPLVYKSVICGNDKIRGANIFGQSFDQSKYLINGFFTSKKHFILRIQLISSCIDLIVIYVDHIHAGKQLAYSIPFYGLEIIILDTAAIRVNFLQ